MKQLRVWLDLCNSPHVLFFRPIADELRQRGMEVVITAQDFGQTLQLLELHGMTYQAVGGQTSRSLLSKGFVTLLRALRLVTTARVHHPDVFVSHGSRAGVMAASLLRIPSITIDDYEHSFTAINNRLSTLLLFPSVIPLEKLVALGVPREKLKQYPGFKEEVYLSTSTLATEPVPAHVDIPPTAITVLLRTPAATAHYHTGATDRLFALVVRLLESRKDTVTLVLGRTVEEQENLSRTFAGKKGFIVLQGALDALSVMSSVDIMIGGGGTMNREAALLGIPTYSYFAGTRGAVDTALEGMGRMHFINSQDDLAKIAFAKRAGSLSSSGISRAGLEYICKEIEGLARKSST